MCEYKHFLENVETVGGARKTTRAVAVFLVGFVCTALAINFAVTRKYWRPSTSVMDAKLVEFEQLRDKIDVLFIGTSHLARGIDPFIFDARMRELGRPTFSYNLSVDNFMHVEQVRLIKRISLHPPPNLRCVFFECYFVGVSNYRNIMTRRIRFAYDWDNTPEAIAFRFFSKRPIKNRLGASLGMCVALGLHTLNIGVFSDLLIPERFREPQTNVSTSGLRGFYPYDITLPEHTYRSRNQNFLAQYRKDGGFPFDEEKEAGLTRELTDVELGIIQRQFDRILATGALVVALAPPSNYRTWRPRSIQNAIREHRPETPTLSYLRESSQDEFYRDALLWLDFDHLSAKGIKRFTTQLATDAFEIIANGDGRAAARKSAALESRAQ